MGLRSLITRGLPDPAEVEHTSALEQILATPFLLPIRVFVNTLLDFRPWWPVLIPWLLFMAWRTYQRERQAYVAELTARQAQHGAFPSDTQRT